MRKFLLLCTIVGSFALNAQIKYGFKVGYVNSTLPVNALNTSVNLSSRSSAYVGLTLEHKLSKKTAIQGDFTIAGLGGEIPYYTGRMDVRLTTILIPVSFKFYITDSFAALGGYNLGFITKEVGEYNQEKGKIEDIKTFNSGPHLGLEYSFTNNIFAEFRYNWGLSKLIDESGVNMKNNFFQIGVGYRYN